MNFAGFSEASLNILEREIQKKNIDFLHEHEPLISTLKENYWLIGWGQENYQKKKRKRKEKQVMHLKFYKFSFHPVSVYITKTFCRLI